MSPAHNGLFRGIHSLGSYRELFDSGLLGAFRTTVDGHMLWANNALANMFGFASVEEMRAANPDTAKIQRVYRNSSDRNVFRNKMLRNGILLDFETQMTRKDGSHLWVSITARVVRDTDGTILYFEGFLYNISRRKQNEKVSSALVRISNAVSVTNDLNDLFHTIHAILKYLINADNFVIGLLDETTDTLHASYVADMYPEQFKHISNISDPKTISLSGHVLRSGKPLLLTRTSEEQLGGTVGISSRVWLGVPLIIQGKAIGVMAVQHYSDPKFYTESHVGIMVSVSEQVALAIERKRNEEQLAYQATHDFLTDLPNRLLFSQRLEMALLRSKRLKNQHFSMLLLDLDRFKLVNDSLGHLAGDELLRQASARLSASLREVDTIARFGGDEFAILLEGTTNAHDTLEVIERLQACLTEPFDLFGQQAHTAASIGVVMNTHTYDKPEDILRDADLAMYKAKECFKTNFYIFDSSLHEKAMRAITIENAMRKGLREEEFHLVFQPIFDLDKTTLSGFEALLRWDSPELGSVFPDSFIPVAEESGLIIELGNWALQAACQTMAFWIRESPAAQNVFMSVNLSPRQFTQPNLAQMVQNALLRSGLKAGNLKLEITESTIMHDVLSANATLTMLNHLGVSTGIDDFGTGYSSLSYLQRYPVETLKIDRSFITELDTKPENLRLVNSIIALAHSLKMTVVAEGVETRDQAKILRELHCEFGQGFFFSKPVLPETALKFISLGAAPMVSA